MSEISLRGCFPEVVAYSDERIDQALYRFRLRFVKKFATYGSINIMVMIVAPYVNDLAYRVS